MTHSLNSQLEAQLIEAGKIIQDGDFSVSPDEAERRFGRYVALVDSVVGTEGINIAMALIRSIQSINDYGGYENTINTLIFKFPPNQVARAMIHELPRLITHFPDWAGDLLNSITQAQKTNHKLIFEFNFALASLSNQEKVRIIEFIRTEEANGWLEHQRGVLGGSAL